MRQWKGHKKPIYTAIFSPCGKYLLTAAGDETVRMWDVGTGAQLLELPGSTVWAPIAWSDDGRFILRGGYTVRCWDTERFRNEEGDWSAELAEQFKTKQNVFRNRTFAESVAFTPDSQFAFLHGCNQSAMLQYSLPDGKPIACGWGGSRESNHGEQFPTGGITIDRGGNRLAAAFGVLGEERYDATVILWNVATGEETGRLTAEPSAPEHATQLAWSPCGRLLAGAYGHMLIVWDCEQMTEVARLHPGGKTHFKGVAFAANGKRLLAANTDKQLRIYDTSDWEHCQVSGPKIGKLHDVAVAPNDRTACIVSHLGRIQIFDIAE